jgi:hypothetical protein
MKLLKEARGGFVFEEGNFGPSGGLWLGGTRLKAEKKRGGLVESKQR